MLGVVSLAAADECILSCLLCPYMASYSTMYIAARVSVNWRPTCFIGRVRCASFTLASVSSTYWCEITVVTLGSRCSRAACSETSEDGFRVVRAELSISARRPGTICHSVALLLLSHSQSQCRLSTPTGAQCLARCFFLGLAMPLVAI
jgi:hypothetical protein